MKRLYVLLLTVSVLLCGCSAKQSSAGSHQTVSRDGIVFVIDAENGTITEGEVLTGEQRQDADTDIGMVIGGLACLGIGLWSALFPHTVLYLRHGWRYRDAEPSDMALTLTRLGGILASIFGAIAFLAGL